MGSQENLGAAANRNAFSDRPVDRLNRLQKAQMPHQKGGAGVHQVSNGLKSHHLKDQQQMLLDHRRGAIHSGRDRKKIAKNHLI